MWALPLILRFLSLLPLLLVSSVSASLSKPKLNGHNLSSLSSSNEIISPECAFPRLKERLFRMISLRESFAFNLILHSECRGQVDVLNEHYIEVFIHLLTLSSQRNVGYYLKGMMRDECYSELMFPAWIRTPHHLPLYVLEILKIHLRHPDGSLIYRVSLEYPLESPERAFLAQWLVELQRSSLKWPFQSNRLAMTDSQNDNRKSHRSRSPLKSKSMKSNSLSWSQLHGLNEFKLADEDAKSVESVISLTSEASATAPTTLTRAKNLNFGYIYGWVSHKGNPIIRNSNKVFNLHGASVCVRDTFLGFASSKLNLEEFASFFVKSNAGTPESFFLKSNSALAQRIKTIPLNKKFAVCRLVAESNGFLLQAIVKGDFNLVVLEAQEGGWYDFKFPTNPYTDLKQKSTQPRTISLPIKPSDIVLFLPRSLFIDQNNSISPHDIAGIFHHTDLSSFAASFVNFINFVHMKTKHSGLIAVGGFVHETEDAKAKKII